MGVQVTTFEVRFGHSVWFYFAAEIPKLQFSIHLLYVPTFPTTMHMCPTIRSPSQPLQSPTWQKLSQ